MKLSGRHGYVRRDNGKYIDAYYDYGVIRDEHHGVFPLPAEERMPCEPNAMRFTPYLLPMSTLMERAEAEAALRLLAYSIKENRWVGATWQQIVATCMNELEAERLTQEIIARNKKNREMFKGQLFRYKIIKILTFGLAGGEMPTFTPEPVNDFVRPSSEAVRSIDRHLESLTARGLLKRVEVLEREIYYPTPALVIEVLKCQ